MFEHKFKILILAPEVPFLVPPNWLKQPILANLGVPAAAVSQSVTVSDLEIAIASPSLFKLVGRTLQLLVIATPRGPPPLSKFFQNISLIWEMSKVKGGQLKNKTEQQSKDALVILVIHQFG